jgi:hypothetical protein
MILPLLAPLLATLASNGLGMVADAVTKKGKEFVEEKLGIDLTQDPSPETVANWKLAAQQHEKELLQMAYGDVANARQREIDVTSAEYAPVLNKIVTPLLALGITTLSFILFAILIFVDVDATSKDILIYILGVLSAAVTQILSYYFGSSMGSKDKDDKLNKLNSESHG